MEAALELQSCPDFIDLGIDMSEDNLLPEQRLFVAMYERALRDLISCVSTENPIVWKRAYSAICWLMDTDKFVDTSFPFEYICSAMGWDAEQMRLTAAKIISDSQEIIAKKAIMEAIRPKKQITKRATRLIKILSWALDDDALQTACKLTNMNVDEVRQAIIKSLSGQRDEEIMKKLSEVGNICGVAEN